MIRPVDPLVVGPTLAFAPYSSREATRRLLHLVYRDCVEVFDITYGGGGFWRDPLPPGIVLSTNTYPRTGNLPEREYSVDFTDSGLDSKRFDLVVYDPPHIADGGKSGIMAPRYGTARGTHGLRWMIQAGFVESCRLARTGVLVKVADHAHGGEWLSLTGWIADMRLGANQYVQLGGPYLYCVLHTYRRVHLNDPKWKVQRVPRSNGATYLCYRLDSPRHRDWDREYARQERPRL